VNDCANFYVQSSPTNPYVCTTVGCESTDHGACCRPSMPLCTWTLAGTFTSTGTTTFPPATESCQGPYGQQTPAPGCPNIFYAQVTVNDSAMCPPQFHILSVYLDRASVSAGQTVTLPNAAIKLQLNDIEPGTKSCQAWTGSLTFDSDVPSWKVSFNVTCSENNKTDVTLSGSIQGNG
jgi:hypothetical protein